MGSTRQCLIFFVALAYAHLGQVESQNAGKPFEKTNCAIRKEAFDYLFDEFVVGKQCSWTRSDSHLREVIVFELSDSQDARNHQGTIKLPKGSSRVIGFFDYIVLRGDQLDSMKFIKIKIDNKHFQIQLAKKEKGEYLFKVPPLPLPDNKTEKDMEVLLSDGEIVEQILFRTKVPFANSFDEYTKRTSVYEGKKGDLADEAQVQFLKKINELNNEILASSLRDRTEEFARIIVPAQLTASTDIISITGILADRRVSKLYEAMSQMNPDDAASFATSSFNNELSRFMGDWENEEILPVRKRYAVEALLFLSSEFSSPKDFISNLDRWENWHSKTVGKKGLQFKNQGRPDFLLVANLYANIIVKQRSMTLEEANGWLDDTLRPIISKGSESPTLQQHWLRSSDWTPGRIDLIADVPIFQSFRSVRNEQTQKRVLERLRSQID